MGKKRAKHKRTKSHKTESVSTVSKQEVATVAAEKATRLWTPIAYVLARPFLRYILLVFLTMSIFYSLYWSKSIYEYNWSKPVVNTQAALAGAVLSVAGYANRTDGNAIVSESESHPFYSLAVGLGCEAIDLTVLCIVAIIFFPESLKKRLVGALLGGIFIQFINIIRIATLYMIGIHIPQHFDLFHHNIWQIILIACVVSFWWVWLRSGVAKSQ